MIAEGQLQNKGAQSMTFNVINRVKEIFPEKNNFVILFRLQRKYEY